LTVAFQRGRGTEAALPIICEKLVGVAAVPQVRMTKADNFGLWPQSVSVKAGLSPKPVLTTQFAPYGGQPE
jgi:hypothetical protein